jgi:hypothetical protein
MRVVVLRPQAVASVRSVKQLRSLPIWRDRGCGLSALSDAHKW